MKSTAAALRPSAIFREPSAARAGGYVLLIAGVLVALGLVFHPMPAGGFEETPSMLTDTPLWGPIHVAISFGFVLCVLGGLLMLVGGGTLTRDWLHALAWGAITVGMIYFTGVALVNGYVMHTLAPHAKAGNEVLLFDAFNRFLIGHGWMGNPLFLFGLTLLAWLEVRTRTTAMPRWLAILGLASACLSWLRGIGSATGFYFLEPFILANVPAFLWLGIYGVRASAMARQQPSHL
jgi:hypothetical protein